MAKKTRRARRRTVDVPVEKLVMGLRQCAEVQLAIADLLDKLPDAVLQTKVPIMRSKRLALSISVGDACRCGRR